MKTPSNTKQIVAKGLQKQCDDAIMHLGHHSPLNSRNKASPDLEQIRCLVWQRQAGCAVIRQPVMLTREANHNVNVSHTLLSNSNKQSSLVQHSYQSGLKKQTGCALGSGSCDEKKCPGRNILNVGHVSQRHFISDATHTAPSLL